MAAQKLDSAPLQPVLLAARWLACWTCRRATAGRPSATASSAAECSAACRSPSRALSGGGDAALAQRTARSPACRPRCAQPLTIRKRLAFLPERVWTSNLPATSRGLLRSAATAGASCKHGRPGLQAASCSPAAVRAQEADRARCAASRSCATPAAGFAQYLRLLGRLCVALHCTAL